MHVIDAHYAHQGLTTAAASLAQMQRPYGGKLWAPPQSVESERMKRLLLAAAAVSLSGLSGCAVDHYGIGLRHHPVDCLVGFPHDDCLEGTAGYENGVGKAKEKARQTVQACVNMGYPMGTDGFLKCLSLAIQSEQGPQTIVVQQRPPTVNVEVQDSRGSGNIGDMNLRGAEFISNANRH
jgi:hypothetical protein